MVNLLVDIGNSSVKVCYADSLKLHKAIRFGVDDDNLIESLILMAQEKDVEIIAISTVRGDDPLLFEPLRQWCKNLIFIDSGNKVPVEIKYATPHTLGSDRVLGSLGAALLFPKKDIIVFDFGTALTIDFVSAKGEFLGGNISLGLYSRFRALNEYTQQLPRVVPTKQISDIGASTVEAIESGVILGLIFEVEGYIKKYPNHIYIFTGGDAIYFVEKLKSSIFVVYNLVLMGLAHVAQDYAKK